VDIFGYGITARLGNPIDNLKKQSEIIVQEASHQDTAAALEIAVIRQGKQVSVTPREIQEDLRQPIHPNRVSRIEGTTQDISDQDLNS
jgi:hypothetical protein